MTTDYRLLIDGQWVEAGPAFAVKNKYDGEVLANVPTARREDVDAAVAAARRGAPLMADMPAYKRSEILARTAALIKDRFDDFATTIAAEAGKALKFARAEVDRAISTFTIASEEAKRMHGETVPLDAVPSGEGYFGFWVRRPVGVIAAISPFNFPLISSPIRSRLPSLRATLWFSSRPRGPRLPPLNFVRRCRMQACPPEPSIW